MKRKQTKSKPERARERVANQSAPPVEPRAAHRPPGSLRSVWIVVSVVALTAVVAWLAAPLFKGHDQAGQAEVRQRVATPPVPAASPTNEAPSATATADHRSAKENDSKLSDLINRANQFLAQNKAAEAVDVLKHALALDPDHEAVHYNLGMALAKLGQSEEAIKEYEEALRLFPDYAGAHNNLGNLLLRVKRRDEAVKHFEQAVNIKPDWASAWNNFGNAVAQLGRASEAHSYFEKATQLDPNYLEAHFNLGTSYAVQKRLPEARHEFETVLRLQPGFAPAQQALARLDRQTAPGP